MKKTNRPVMLGYMILGANVLLFLLKIVAFYLSNSIAILSDAVNSLTDSIASIVVTYSIHIGQKDADESHPFGHHRVEPLAAFFVSVVAVFLAFDIIKNAIGRFSHQENIILHPISVGVILFTIGLKFFMFVKLKKEAITYHSPSLEAGSMDARNDVFVSSLVLIGVIATSFHWYIFDPIAAILLGLWIIKTAWELGRKNIDFLVGKSADTDLVTEIKAMVSQIPHIEEIKHIHTHYVGSKIHVELTVEVRPDMSIHESHQLTHAIQDHLQTHREVADAFVHIEPREM